MGVIDLTRRASNGGDSGTLRAENRLQTFKVNVVVAENDTVRRFFFGGGHGKGGLYVPEMARSSGANV